MVEKEHVKRSTLIERAANLQKQQTNKEQGRSKTTAMLATALLAATLASVPIYNKLKSTTPTNSNNVITSTDSRFSDGKAYVISKKDLANTVIEIKDSDVSPTRIKFDKNGNVAEEFDLQIGGKKKQLEAKIMGILLLLEYQPLEVAQFLL